MRAQQIRAQKPSDIFAVVGCGRVVVRKRSISGEGTEARDYVEEFCRRRAGA
jgi:hypothetical protein